MAGFIPPEIINEIQAKTDIVELVSSYINLKKQGKNFVGLCPFHSENTPSFSVSPEKQIFYCFGCQKGGTAINFVMDMEGLTFPEAAEKLADKAGIAIPNKDFSPEDMEKYHQKQALYELHRLTAEFYQDQLWHTPAGHVGREYLQSRGLDKELAIKFSLGYAPESQWDLLAVHLKSLGYEYHQMELAGLISKSAKTGRYYDKFRGRLIFPIYDYRGYVVAFGGRILGAGQPKYLNSTETLIYSKSKNLYGLTLAVSAIRNCDEAVLMEGYMDVIIAHQHGITNAIASLGTAFTVEQAKLLRRYTSRVLLSYDGDSAGFKASQRGLEILRENNFKVKVLTLPDGLDPDDFLKKYSKPGWDKLVKVSAKSLLEFYLLTALKKYDIDTIEGKAAVVEEVLPIISKSTSSVERDSFIRLLGRKLSVSVEMIYADLQKKGVQLDAVPKKINNADDFSLKAKHFALKDFNPLVRLMLEEKGIYALVENNLDLDFPMRDEEKELLLLVKSLGTGYNWQPSSLLNYISDEGLKIFLLNLLNIEIPDTDRENVAVGYIKSYAMEKLQQQVAAVNQQLAQGNLERKPLLEQIKSLQMEIQNLKKS